MKLAALLCVFQLAMIADARPRRESAPATRSQPSQTQHGAPAQPIVPRAAEEPKVKAEALSGTLRPLFPSETKPDTRPTDLTQGFRADDGMTYKFRRAEPFEAATPVTDKEFKSYVYGPGEAKDPSAAEMAMLQAVRSVVYPRPDGSFDTTHSTEGEMDPVLCANARLAAKALAARGVQNHYGWDTVWEAPVKGKVQKFAPRFHSLRNQGYSNATEIVSESWPDGSWDNKVPNDDVILALFKKRIPYDKLTNEQKLLVHAQSCVRGWMGSKGHKGVMDRKPRSGRFCYSMARGKNGTFYCAGIVD